MCLPACYVQGPHFHLACFGDSGHLVKGVLPGFSVKLLFLSYYFPFVIHQHLVGRYLGTVLILVTPQHWPAALTHPLVLRAWVCDWDVGTGQCSLRLSFSLHSLVGFLLHRTSLSSFLSTHLVDSNFIHWVIILLLSILVPILPLHAGSSGRSPTL